jgi:hypothetical protein
MTKGNSLFNKIMKDEIRPTHKMRIKKRVRKVLFHLK